MQREPLHYAKRELSVAERAVGRMKIASTIDEFEDEWRTFLGAIEKAWIKVEVSCRQFRNTFQPWQSQFHSLRKKDPLLRYLKHARNSDQHNVQEALEMKDAQREISLHFPGAGQSAHVDLLVINGPHISYHGNAPLVVNDLPRRLELVSIKDSGNWYNPPSSHLNKALPWSDPVLVSELGLQFYKNFINEVELKFFQ